jgi:hypothetical protein
MEKELIMEKPEAVMIERLARKGLTFKAIPAYIRNLQTAIREDPYINLATLNMRLNLLGWNEIELDYFTMQLIKACLESDAGQRYFLPNLSRGNA